MNYFPFSLYVYCVLTMRYEYFIGVFIFLMNRIDAFQIQPSSTEGSKSNNIISNNNPVPISVPDSSHTLLNATPNEGISPNPVMREEESQSDVNEIEVSRVIPEEETSNETRNQKGYYQNTQISNRQQQTQKLLECSSSKVVIHMKEPFKEPFMNETISQGHKKEETNHNVSDDAVVDIQESIQKTKMQDNRFEISENVPGNPEKTNESYVLIYGCERDLMILKRMMIFVILTIAITLILKLFLKDLELIKVNVHPVED